MKFNIFSSEKKEETHKCNWCGKELEKLPFSKTKKGKEYWFCSKECMRNFRIRFNALSKRQGCSSCLLKKIQR